MLVLDINGIAILRAGRHMALHYYRYVRLNGRAGRVNNVYVCEGQDGISSGRWSADLCYRENYKEDAGKRSLHGYLIQLAKLSEKPETDVKKTKWYTRIGDPDAPLRNQNERRRPISSARGTPCENTPVPRP